MYLVQYDIHVTCMQGGKRNGSEKGEEGGKRYREGREEKGKRGGSECDCTFCLEIVGEVLS